MKFKIGDIVKVIYADEKTSTPSTEGMIGQIGKIVKLSGYYPLPYTVYFEADDVKFNFMAKEIVLNIKVGEQLLFDFMNKE